MKNPDMRIDLIRTKLHSGERVGRDDANFLLLQLDRLRARMAEIPAAAAKPEFSPARVSFRAVTGVAGDDQLHVAEESNGRKAERMVGYSGIARWLSRRFLVNELVNQYRGELMSSLRDHEWSLEKQP